MDLQRDRNEAKTGVDDDYLDADTVQLTENIKKNRVTETLGSKKKKRSVNY